jgi:TonB family protein
MKSAFFCLLLSFAAPGSAQPPDPSDLIRQARSSLTGNPDKGRADAERFLREARELSAGKADVYSEASVLLALVLLGGGRPAGEISALIEEVLPIYERSEDAKLALALEIKASVSTAAEADALKKRASAIRMAIIRDLTRQSDEPLPATEGPFRVADTTTAPRILEKPEPPYSDAARIAKHQGAVLLSLTIDTNGKTRDVRLVRSLGFDLDEAAWHTVKKWRFDPAIRQEQPVPVRANVEINFRLL